MTSYGSASASTCSSAAVGALRYEAGRRPDDRQLTALIDEWRAHDADVATRWDDHGVADRPSVPKQVAHPIAGPLSFDIEAIASPLDPQQRLVVYTVEPGSPTFLVLPLLAGWDAKVVR